MKKKKNLHLHLIPHFQKIEMYHINPKNLVSNPFQFEVVHEENPFETMNGYKFLVSLIIDFDKFQSISCNCFPHCLTPPLVYFVKMLKHGWGHG